MGKNRTKDRNADMAPGAGTSGSSGKDGAGSRCESRKDGAGKAASFCAVFGLALILAVAAVCAPLAIPRILGYEAYSIVSGSMEPGIPVGSMAYAKAADPEGIAVGDVIVFHGGADGSAVTTHRVAEKDDANGRFFTKGDANEGNDPNPVPYGRVIGKVERTVPFLGYVLPALSSARGKAALGCVLLAGVLFRVLGGRLRKDGM